MLYGFPNWASHLENENNILNNYKIVYTGLIALVPNKSVKNVFPFQTPRNVSGKAACFSALALKYAVFLPPDLRNAFSQ